MEPLKQAFIFIGQSGAGKGTQTTLFEQKIRSHFPDQPLLHLETGAVFRSFVTTDSYTALRTKKMLDDGLLPPSFIGVHVWSHELIAQYSGQPFVIIDGAPRNAVEVPVLLSAATFYDWNVHVIYLEVGDTWAHDRLIGRNRIDDQDEHDRNERIKWFHTNVKPGIDILKESPNVHFLAINGERSIEEIHADIWEKVGL